MNSKLLVIDDEEVLLNNIKSFFGRKGYQVFTSSTGDSGLELLKQNDPDFLLLDLHLKEGIQGMNVLKKALELKPGLKIAILSGFGKDEEIIKTCLNLGAKAVLKKPMTLDTLKKEVEKLKEL